MTGDFNIRNNDWDPSYLYHSTYIDNLREIAESFDLELSMSVNQVLMWYTDNSQDSNLVLDLMFPHTNIEEFNNHSILTNLQGPSFYASLSVYIIIKEEFIQEKKLTIIKNNKEEKEFINKLRNRVSYIKTTNILIYERLDEGTQKFTSITEKLWYKHSKYANITKYSKVW